MAEKWHESARPPQIGAKRRVAAIAARQQSRITSAQLRTLDVSYSTIRDWTRSGYLHPRRPRVYAVGSPAPSTTAARFEAILYAGPGAMLSHASAAHHLGLIDHPPRAVHVRTPRRTRSISGIVVHPRSPHERIVHDALPTTTIPDTMLDLATLPNGERLLRRALARLDFTGRLDAGGLWAIDGRTGCPALRAALAAYDPRFAHTWSPLEDDWVLACGFTGTPKPDRINAVIEGIPSDAVYDDARVIVEIDGVDNHRSPAQIRRDRRNDFTLRSHGWVVFRYGGDQLRADVHAVTGEVHDAVRQRQSR